MSPATPCSGLRELANEGWIESRRGSGSRVKKVQRIQSSTAKATRLRGQVTLAPFISEAFERPEVTLDVYTLTSESLDAHIRLQSERIRGGFISPQRITLRMLLPDPSLPLPYPRVKGIWTTHGCGNGCGPSRRRTPPLWSAH